MDRGHAEKRAVAMTKASGDVYERVRPGADSFLPDALNSLLPPGMIKRADQQRARWTARRVAMAISA